MSNDFKKLKQGSWVYYKQWMKEKTYSPALNREIKITRRGWDHLTKSTNSKYRNVRDKINRLHLLKSARYIIRNSKSFTVNVENNIKYYVLENNFNKSNSVVKVRVILKKDQEGRLYFFSVMKR